MTAELRVTLEQGYWWTPADGLQRRIADLTPGHRINCARFLLRSADRYYAAHRLLAQFMLIGGVGGYHDDDMGGWDEEDWAELDEEIRVEIAAGRHLAWMRARPLYRALDPSGELPDPVVDPPGLAVNGRLAPGTLIRDDF